EMDQASGEGFGLMGMHERAQRLNGALEVRSAPGRGTVVSVRVPVRAAGPAQADGLEGLAERQGTSSSQPAEQKVRS
ncbi:MAG: ATP-binding protein, partial [Terriglobia bacterium]